jgi:peptidoglycan hydrolase-like protein with peptidoglycan-binding domain
MLSPLHGVDGEDRTMMERSRRLRIICRSALLVAFVAAAVVPAAEPVAADAEIAAHGADGAPACSSAPGKADMADVDCVSSPPFNLVKAAQRFLADQANQDYQPGPVDGVAGPMTRAAVMAWQRDHALDANGALNSATLASMGLAPQ